MISRRTIRDGAVGAVVGSVLGFVPLVLLVAPVIGAVAGYLERDGPRRGTVAGGVAVLLRSGLVVGTHSVLGERRRAETADSTHQCGVPNSTDETLGNATFCVSVPTENVWSRDAKEEDRL
jgi:hypothetical protein